MTLSWIKTDNLNYRLMNNSGCLGILFNYGALNNNYKDGLCVCWQENVTDDLDNQMGGEEPTVALAAYALLEWLRKNGHI